MKKSNDGQYAKAKKDYGKDFFAKTGGSSDSGLKKGATTMEKDSVKVGRFATGGALRQPRDGNMKFAKGGAVPRHSMKEDALDKKADAISAKKRGMKPSAFEGAPADERMDKMGTKFPRNKAAKFATGGAAKPVKRNMGGMMGSPNMGMEGPRNPPALGIARPRGIGGSQPGVMAPPSPAMGVDPMQQGGEGGQFRRGGKVAKFAVGGAGKIRHKAMTPAGKPMTPRKAGKSEQVI